MANEVGDHGGVAAPGLTVDILNGLLAATVLDVEVDVRRFGAFARDEALEEQAHAYRIDGRDAEAIAHGGIGGRAAPLAENVVFATEGNQSMHGQEVAVVIEFGDEL